MMNIRAFFGQAMSILRAAVLILLVLAALSLLAGTGRSKSPSCIGTVQSPDACAYLGEQSQDDTGGGYIP
jgi:hypothetical protein